MTTTDNLDPEGAGPECVKVVVVEKYTDHSTIDDENLCDKVCNEKDLDLAGEIDQHCICANTGTCLDIIHHTGRSSNGS